VESLLQFAVACLLRVSTARAATPRVSAVDSHPIPSHPAIHPCQLDTSWSGWTAAAMQVGALDAAATSDTGKGPARRKTDEQGFRPETGWLDRTVCLRLRRWSRPVEGRRVCVFQWWVWWVFAMAMLVFPVAMWLWSAECTGLAFGLPITSPVQGMCMPGSKSRETVLCSADGRQPLVPLPPQCAIRPPRSYEKASERVLGCID
jgi:hypothetical protein